MSLGSTPRQGDVFRSTTEFCAPRVRPDSIHALLHRECFSLFPDALFADLFADLGRRSVPPLIVAVVMVLQRLEGLSDREAVERFTFDARWKYAAGGLPFDHPGFAHTVLVDMRARLARSDRPNRIFERTLEVAPARPASSASGGCSTPRPLYDAVATMDTVTLVRSAIRGVLAAAGEREPALRSAAPPRRRLPHGGKPACDWEDAEARLGARRRPRPGRRGPPRGARGRARSRRRSAQAATLLATVLGQDLEDGPDGRIRIARRVAPRPGHLHGRPRGPPRPQDGPPQLRRVQGPPRARSGRRARDRDRRHARQRRRRDGGRSTCSPTSSPPPRRAAPSRRSPCTATPPTGRARSSRRSRKPAP